MEKEITKTCTKCGVEKELYEFRKNKNTKDGLRLECKLCSKIMCDNYYKNNKDKVKNINKNWRINNPEKAKEYSKKYYKLHSLKKQKSTKKWADNNQEKIKLKNQNYSKKRRLNDPLYKLSGNIRTMVGDSLRKNGYTKKSRTHEILGCTYEFFISYVEAQWSLPHNLDKNGELWMNWSNYGKYKKDMFNYGWDIDHIIPLNSAKTEKELLFLFHFSNQQPLCSKINRDIKRATKRSSVDILGVEPKS